MFNIRHQEQRISELKTRIGAEREAARRQIRMLVPQVRRAAVVGSFAWGVRKALPLLQPLAISLAGRGLGKTAIGGLAKTMGLAAVAVGVWRWSRPQK